MLMMQENKIQYCLQQHGSDREAIILRWNLEPKNMSFIHDLVQDCGNPRGLLLLTWINFNRIMDK